MVYNNEGLRAASYDELVFEFKLQYKNLDTVIKDYFVTSFVCEMNDLVNDHELMWDDIDNFEYEIEEYSDIGTN